jgi:hypothetical protein
MKYRVTQAPFGVPIGFVMRLTESQAEPRAARLRRRDDGAYEVTEPIEFKAGERIEIVEGDLGRYEEGRLEKIEESPVAQSSRRVMREENASDRQTGGGTAAG